MNAICPRCGTITLAGSQTTRFTCKTCRLRFCGECQHWKVNRKQNYCARCGAAFGDPPPVMPSRAAAVVFYVPILAALLLSAFIPLRFWQLALAITAPLVAYTLGYLAVFYRRTGLAQATRREAILLGRPRLDAGRHRLCCDDTWQSSDIDRRGCYRRRFGAHRAGRAARDPGRD